MSNLTREHFEAHYRRRTSRPPANIYLSPTQKRKATKCDQIESRDTQPTDDEIEEGFARGVELSQSDRWLWYVKRELENLAKHREHHSH